MVGNVANGAIHDVQVSAFPFAGFDLTNAPIGDFQAWSRQGAIALTGRFDDDKLDDIVLIPTSLSPYWTTLPVAFSNGDGGFRVTNTGVTTFPAAARQMPRLVAKGRFDKNGRDDLIMLGGEGWTTVPVALSNGDGSFKVVNAPSDLARLSRENGAAWGYRTIVVLDVNGDHCDDVALLGGPTDNELTIGFSNCDGTFGTATFDVPMIAAWVRQGGKPVVGDFNGDGYDDIALTRGGADWYTIPVAFSNGLSFNVTNLAAGSFPLWSRQPGARVVTGDFDGDKKTDLALVSGNGWRSVPVALSNGNGTFRITNPDVGDFGSWAQITGNKAVIARDFNGDGRTDLAIAGDASWGTIPVAFSNGAGAFSVVNSGGKGAMQLEAWTALAPTDPATAAPLGGHFRATQGDDIVILGHADYRTIPMAHAASVVTFDGPVCGDGACNGAETCGTCAKDCGPCPTCGDHACNGKETCSTCPTDCGACACTKRAFPFCIGGTPASGTGCTLSEARTEALSHFAGWAPITDGPCPPTWCGGTGTSAEWCCKTTKTQYWGAACTASEADAAAKALDTSCPSDSWSKGECPLLPALSPRLRKRLRTRRTRQERTASATTPTAPRAHAPPHPRARGRRARTLP